jgi:hypothetical protein
MQITKNSFKDGTAVVFCDGLSVNGFLANNLYIYLDVYNNFILGSGTFTKNSDSETQLIELIQNNLK